ncbi:MAG: helicase-related protein, partial [Chloroflexota bacterium]
AVSRLDIYPARHFVTSQEKLAKAIVSIEEELGDRLKELEAQGKLLEAQRLQQRTNFDVEMLRETGICAGIENYSRHLAGRGPGEKPWTLLDYLPDDFLLMVDESHVALPQVRGMFGGDRSRKDVLVDYGFRLPSALDNRPLTFDEFERTVSQAVYVSATPGPYEYEHSSRVVEQVIRPTWLLDPTVEVRPTKGQIDLLIERIRERVARKQRVLVTTLTKRMAEDLAEYLRELAIKVHYLHSEMDVMERVEVLRDLRLGTYDVVVGINLLREGLDLPEVSLIAILDADKEGYLRSETSLIQTMGRAARHVEGHVIMFADRETNSMQRAIAETNRRRALQMAYNEAHGVVPTSIVKGIRDLGDQVRAVAETAAGYTTAPELSREEILWMVKELETQMRTAARQLDFERAAELRDQVIELRRRLEEGVVAQRR